MKKIILILMCCFFVGAVSAQKVVKPRAGGGVGTWKVLGTTHASHSADHDVIIVKGPSDNFRKLKFAVRDAPLNITRMIVTYDKGGAQNINTRYEIRKNGESREIDLNGGSRSIKKIQFWYDTKGFLNGTADVTVFGRK